MSTLTETKMAFSTFAAASLLATQKQKSTKKEIKSPTRKGFTERILNKILG